jgi:hypothetical protein
MSVHPLSTGYSFPLELIVLNTGSRTCKETHIRFHHTSPYFCYARQVVNLVYVDARLKNSV